MKSLMALAHKRAPRDLKTGDKLLFAESFLMVGIAGIRGNRNPNASFSRGRWDFKFGMVMSWKVAVIKQKGGPNLKESEKI